MNEKESISNLLLYKAHEDMGMYPQATTSGGITTKRTEWQNGWNEALMKLTTKWCKLNDWYSSLSDNVKPVISALLYQDILMLCVRDEEVKIGISMSDTFMYACADAEEADIAELPLISQLYEKYGWDGLVAWSARKRKDTPIEERITAGYIQARKFLEE